MAYEDKERYAKAFKNYLRLGMDQGIAGEADQNGRFLVPLGMTHHIMQAVADLSPFRRVASVTAIQCDGLVVQDKKLAPEGISPISTATDAPEVRNRTIPAHELYAQPKGTRAFVETASLDVEAWLAAKAADIFAQKESEAFIHGTGVGQPHGLLSYGDRVEVTRSGANGQVTAEGILGLVRSLSPEFAKRAAFLMNRSTVQTARVLQDQATGSYLWEPGLSAGASDSLAGLPVHIVNDMPTPERGSLSVAVGDFQAAYQIVDRADIRVLRDPFSEKPFVKFYVAKWVGGDVVNPAAIRVLRLAE